MLTHEIPTHLHGADPVVAGCTWSQLFILGGGAAGAFWGWHTVLMPPVVRAGLCTAPVLVALACAFWRPDGHGLLTWLGLVAAYTATPRRVVWQREAANDMLVAPLALPAVGAHGARGSSVEGATRRSPATSGGPGEHALSAHHRVRSRHTSALPDGPRGMARVVTPVVPARRRGGPLAVLLGQRVLCLSTHHLHSIGKEGGA
jgi:hypothetical protein